MGAGSGVGALAGFAQLGLGIALLIVLTTHLRHAGPGSCSYAAADEDGLLVCDLAAWLSFLSVGSSLIISVGQGALSLVAGVPARSVEVLSRLALAVAWTVLAVLATIATVESDDADHSPSRTHWRHVGLGLTWGLTFLALVMAATAGAGALCGDCPVAALLCCCLPCCCCCPPDLLPVAHAHHRLGLCGDHGGDCCGTCCELTGLACCLYWCLPRSWFGGGGSGTTTTTTTTVYYQPVPGAPPPPPPPHHQGGYPVAPPHAGPGAPPPHPPAGGPSAQAYAPPTVLGPPVQPPSYYPPIGSASAAPPQASAPPLIAPVYSPFTQGPTPPTLGWGVPVLPPAAPSFYPPVLPPAPGEAGPSAPPAPSKAGYEPPTAPPGPYS